MTPITKKDVRQHILECLLADLSVKDVVNGDANEAIIDSSDMGGGDSS